MLRDDGDAQLAEDKDPKADNDEILYELLGLVTLAVRFLCTNFFLTCRWEIFIS